MHTTYCCIIVVFIFLFSVFLLIVCRAARARTPAGAYAEVYVSSSAPRAAPSPVRAADLYARRGVAGVRPHHGESMSEEAGSPESQPASQPKRAQAGGATVLVVGGGGGEGGGVHLYFFVYFRLLQRQKSVSCVGSKSMLHTVFCFLGFHVASHKYFTE